MNTSMASALLRVLDVILNVARFFLFLATILFALLAVVNLFGSGTVSLDGTTDAVELRYTDDEGQVITVLDGNASMIEQPGTADPAIDRATVIPNFGRTAVTVELEERAPRFAALGFITLLFVLAWVAATSMQRITRTALDGDMFTRANATRLTLVGAAAVVFAVVGAATPRVMDALIDSSTLPVDGFRTAGQVSDPWLWLMVGLLFMGVGGAFHRGVELEALDAATI